MNEAQDVSIEPRRPPTRRRKAPPDEKPDLPAAAEKANDLEALKKTVKDAANVSGGLWLSYLFVLFYIGVAAGAVTHADLFLQRPVKLPFLGIELPLTVFFAIAPILFLITYAYALVHFVLLAAKAKRFHTQLRAQIQDKNAPEVAALREGLRSQLPSNIFVQFLAGPRELREGWFGRLVAAIILITFVIGPVALLLLLQLRFLPYHDSSITWTHRVALLLEFVLVWWLWRKIVAGQTEIDEPQRWPAWGGALSIAVTAAVVVFSWTLATFPGEWENRPLAWIASIAPPELNKWRSAGNEWLFNGEVDDISRRRVSWFSNTLVLPGFSLYDALKIDDPKKVEWHDLFDARGRDLKGAVFAGATLPRTDFYHAQLEGVSFFVAQLQYARFQSANLQGAMLDGAQLQGASLQGAHLQGASLQGARLQGASLQGVELQGARLSGYFQGAMLQGARLEGASLDSARLEGASLDSARLEGASLRGAHLQGASLQSAELLGARLDDADMTATNLSHAFVWRAVFPRDANNLSAAGLNWRPVAWDGQESSPWTSARYNALMRQIAEIVPEGGRQKWALGNLGRLDCETGEPWSCDAKAEEPAAVAEERQMIEHASVDHATHENALAGVLGELVCGGDGDAIYILRGLATNERIKDAAPEALALVDRIMNKDDNSKDCPVSAVLTDDDKARLRAIVKAVAPPVPLQPPPPPKQPAQPPARKK